MAKESVFITCNKLHDYFINTIFEKLIRTGLTLLNLVADGFL